MVNLVNQLNLNEETKTIVYGIKENGSVDNNLNSILSVLSSKKANLAKFGEITSYYPLDQFNFNRIVFVGLGCKANYSLKDLQTLFSKVAKEVNEDFILDVDTFSVLNPDLNQLVEKIVETLLLVKYRYIDYKTDKKSEKDIEISIYCKEDVNEAINSGVINAESTNHARTLINEPRNKLTASTLAEYAENLAKTLNIEYKIYNKKEIRELGMGAFLAVNQGSKEEAKLIHLKYRGRSDAPITALIGKGVTYDSGGYSIKSKDGMAGMKGDMGGAASVLGAIEAIARKKLSVNVDVIIAATDNLISNDAIVPDDVVVAMNGKTIEILNTDAEGRLTLVDAVTFAKTKEASTIIDLATLTGGVVTALGTEITGAFTNNNELLERVKNASVEAGEKIWELPVDEFREATRRSEVADYNNSPGRAGHASFAAALIAEFVEDTPWVHLDIAGTSDKRSSHLLGPAGGTGVMVRTLVKLFE